MTFEVCLQITNQGIPEAQTMASPIHLQGDEHLREKIDKRAHAIFKAKVGEPQLQVHRLFTTGATEEPKRLELVKNQDVDDISQIEALEKAGDDFQIFIIRQYRRRSWTTLDISRELIQDFSRVYNIFPPFWKTVFTFGTKYYRENEFEFPRFRSSQTSICDTLSDVQESTYVLRRVELHNRELSEGQSPWSIRQTGVYHRLTYDSNSSAFTASPAKCSKSAFLLISPSVSIERQISKCIEGATLSREKLSPWDLHLLLIAESQEGWMDYMAWLEENLMEQSTRIALAQVGVEGENDDLSPFTDFTIEITDRQKLKLVEDSVIELQIILSTMLNTVIRIRKDCRICCKRYHVKETCGCKRIVQDLDEYTQEVEMHVERAQSLRDRARSTIQLLSDLLSYEDAAALKDIARQSRQESEAMHALTEQSAKDAAAVKVLTIIGLIYLPTTIVLNFFSTQFVHSTETGNIKVSHQTWLLVAFAVPLTMFTIGVWWAWAHWASLLDVLRKHQGPTFWRWATTQLELFLSGKWKRKKDVESGVPSSEAAVPQNSSSIVFHYREYNIHT